MLRPFGLFLIAAFAIGLVGCDPPRTVFHVSGQATYRGQPIPRGRICFDPTGGGSEQGIAEIVDGRFDTEQSDLGITGGKYVVRVQGFDGIGGDELPWGQPLFNEYEMMAELKAEDQKFNVEVPK